MFKQVLVIRKDLRLGVGKAAAQAAHASLLAYRLAPPAVRVAWEEEGAKKVVLAVPSEEELRQMLQQAKRAKLPCALVTDAGLTQVPSGTATALGIGPCLEAVVDKFTRHLKLL